MNDMTKERAIELFPWIEKLSHSEIVSIALEIMKFMLLGKDSSEHILNALTVFMKDKPKE